LRCCDRAGTRCEQRHYALNSAGWAPSGWTPEFFRDRLRVEQVPGEGVNAATVPGAISCYAALLERFGNLTFRETFERAARIAEEGWGQAERRHRDLLEVLPKLERDPDSNRTFLSMVTRRPFTASFVTPTSRARCGSSRSRDWMPPTRATSRTRSLPRCAQEAV
jgi:gamma-glutamyltranspeptidase